MSTPPPLLVYSADQVQQAVQKMAGEITAWWENFLGEPLHLVCVLEGAKPLVRDLQRRLAELNPEGLVQEHFIQVQATQGRELLQTRQWVGEAGDEHWGPGPVLVVDDLLDSGKTLDFIKEHLSARRGTAFKTAVLIRKYADGDTPVDFLGLDLGLRKEELTARGLKDYWLYGYGMDLDGKHRDLDYVVWVEVK